MSHVITITVIISVAVLLLGCNWIATWQRIAFKRSDDWRI